LGQIYNKSITEGKPKRAKSQKVLKYGIKFDLNLNSIYYCQIILNTYKAMNTQHTSGPWNFKRQGFKISIGNVDTGATKHGHDYTVAEINDNSLRAEANARLIAAAPELLEALVMAYSFMVTDPKHQGRVILETLKTAIDKATI